MKETGKEGVTPQEEKKHKKIAAAVRTEMLKPVKGKGGSFEQLHAAKRQQAKALEEKYQKQLSKGIKISILLGGIRRRTRRMGMWM